MVGAPDIMPSLWSWSFRSHRRNVFHTVITKYENPHFATILGMDISQIKFATPIMLVGMHLTVLFAISTLYTLHMVFIINIY